MNIVQWLRQTIVLPMSVAVLAFLFCSQGSACAQFTLINVGHINNGGSAIGVTVAGNFAYVGNDQDGLRVYDVSNPANPINIAHVNDGAQAFGVAESGGFLYLANREDGLRIYNVSDPFNPLGVGHVNNGGRAKHVALSGGQAFLANEFDGLRVYNISNPSNPINIGHTNNNVYPIGSSESVAISENIAYVASAGSGLLIYDVSVPTRPAYRGSADGTNRGFALGVAASNHYAYVAYYYADNSGGLRIYDTSNPAQPLRVGYTNTGAAFGVALSGRYAFISDYLHGLCVEDISNPTNPVVVACAADPGVGSPGVAVSGNYVYLAHAADGLRIYLFAPQLSLTLTSSNVACLSWPVPLAPGFVLQQNSDLNPTSWQTVTNLPVVNSNRNQVTVSLSGSQAFYRLLLQ